MARNTGASGNQPDQPFSTDDDAGHDAGYDDSYEDDYEDDYDDEPYGRHDDAFAPDMYAMQGGYNDLDDNKATTLPTGGRRPRSMSDADALALLATEDSDGRALTPERRAQEDRRPVVSSSRWLPPETPEEKWRTDTLQAITGKRRTLRPQQKRTLPKPRRFRRPAPIRSGVLLVVTGVLVLLGSIGLVDLGRQAVQYAHTLQHPTAVPTHPKKLKATPAPTHAPTATATPSS